MRQIILIEHDYDLFDDMITSANYDYFIKHKDVFKRMWKEQGTLFWSRYITTFRTYSSKYGMIRDLPGKPNQYDSIIDQAFVFLQEQFVDGKFSQAKQLILDIVVVAQNRHLVANIEAKSCAKDPFYKKDTRDAFRNVFGEPNDKESYVKIYLLLNMYLKFAASIIACLKRWVHAPKIDSSDESYWTDSIEPPVKHSKRSKKDTDINFVDKALENPPVIPYHQDPQWDNYFEERIRGKPDGPCFIREWKEGDPRFIDPRNPLYCSTVDPTSDWREVPRKLEFPKFREFKNFAVQKYKSAKKERKIKAKIERKLKEQEEEILAEVKQHRKSEESAENKQTACTLNKDALTKEGDMRQSENILKDSNGVDKEENKESYKEICDNGAQLVSLSCAPDSGASNSGDVSNEREKKDNTDRQSVHDLANGPLKTPANVLTTEFQEKVTEMLASKGENISTGQYEQEVRKTEEDMERHDRQLSQMAAELDQSLNSKEGRLKTICNPVSETECENNAEDKEESESKSNSSEADEYCYSNDTVRELLAGPLDEDDKLPDFVYLSREDDESASDDGTGSEQAETVVEGDGAKAKVTVKSRDPGTKNHTKGKLSKDVINLDNKVQQDIAMKLGELIPSEKIQDLEKRKGHSVTFHKERGDPKRKNTSNMNVTFTFNNETRQGEELASSKKEFTDTVSDLMKNNMSEVPKEFSKGTENKCQQISKKESYKERLRRKHQEKQGNISLSSIPHKELGRIIRQVNDEGVTDPREKERVLQQRFEAEIRKRQLKAAEENFHREQARAVRQRNKEERREQRRRFGPETKEKEMSPGFSDSSSSTEKASKLIVEPMMPDLPPIPKFSVRTGCSQREINQMVAGMQMGNSQEPSGPDENSFMTSVMPTSAGGVCPYAGIPGVYGNMEPGTTLDPSSGPIVLAMGTPNENGEIINPKKVLLDLSDPSTMTREELMAKIELAGNSNMPIMFDPDVKYCPVTQVPLPNIPDEYIPPPRTRHRPLRCNVDNMSKADMAADIANLKEKIKECEIMVHLKDKQKKKELKEQKLAARKSGMKSDSKSRASGDANEQIEKKKSDSKQRTMGKKMSDSRSSASDNADEHSGKKRSEFQSEKSASVFKFTANTGDSERNRTSNFDAGDNEGDKWATLSSDERNSYSLKKKLKNCTRCGILEHEPKAFKKCSKCKEEKIPNARFYCGRVCQAEDWTARHRKEHKDGKILEVNDVQTL